MKKNIWGQTNKTRSQEYADLVSAQQKYDRNRRMPPEVSGQMANSVSVERRALLEDQVNNGFFREAGSIPQYLTGHLDTSNGAFIPNGVGRDNNTPDFSIETQAGVVAGASMKKTANFGSNSFGGSANVGTAWRGNNDSLAQVPELYSPLWLNSNLNLPRDRVTINTWCRSFFALNPIVQNAISLHSTYPISKLNIKSKNRRVEKFFADMIEEIDLMNICVQIAQEYWTLGEAFVYGELDESTAKWKRLLIQNPDNISVERTVNAGEPIISLRPDENLKRIVMGATPADIQQRRQLDPSIVEYVKKNQNIPLNNFYISHLARKISPYEVRGTGLIVSCFKSLMLMDKLKESKFAQADNMVNPLTLVKIGNSEFRPTPVDIDSWRRVFEAAQNDKDFKIFTHDAVNIERIGYGQGIYDISGDIQQAIKEIYIGLMVPSVLMDGTDTTYANGSVALDVLRQRYMQFRNMLASWLKRKIFAPISKLNGFYEYVEGEKTLIVPEIDWNHMSLFDANDYIGHMMALVQDRSSDQPNTNKVSVQTLYRSIGLEYEDELRKMRYEDIQNTIRQKELLSLDRYSLSELRALTPDDEIAEPVNIPLPGEAPLEPPDEDMPGLLPGGGGGPKPGGGVPSKRPGGPPRPPMGAGGAPPKGPGGVPKKPGAPSGGPPAGGGAPPAPPV